MNTEKKAAPTIIVIFGGTGDLASRKLIPAFYNLYLDDRMADNFAIFGLGRSDFDDTSYRKDLYKKLKEFSRRDPDSKIWKKFEESIYYFKSDITNEKSYQDLHSKLDNLDKEWGERANRLFYLSVSPKFIDDITANLKNQKRVEGLE